MLNKPIVHEFDHISLFLRSQELGIHQKKLKAIKVRKNIFFNNSNTNNETELINSSRKKSPSKGFTILQNYFIDRDNRYLCDRLFQISNRSINKNQPTKNTLISTCSQFEPKTKLPNFIVHKKLQEKKIVEENVSLLKRLAEKHSSINFNKLDDEYLSSRQIVKQLSKVKGKKLSQFNGKINCSDLKLSKTNAFSLSNSKNQTGLPSIHVKSKTQFY